MNLGMPEMIMIFLLALLLFGPRKLPEIGRTVGRAMSEFRRATDELKHSLTQEVDFDKQADFRGIKKELSDFQNDIRKAADFSDDIRQATDIKDDLKNIGNDLKG